MATTTRSITNGCKDIRERREEKQDPQTPDIPNTFMHTEREEVMMEGKEGVKAHNVIGGERKIDRSRKAKVRQIIEISNKGKIEEIEITNLLWAQISKQNREYDKEKQLDCRGKLFKTNKKHVGMGQTHKNVSTLPYREMSILEDETQLNKNDDRGTMGWGKNKLKEQEKKKRERTNNRKTTRKDIPRKKHHENINRK